METFDRVRRVDQLTNRWIVFKIRTELCPVIPPGGDDNGILFAPLLVKGIKLLFSEFFRGRLVDFFEIGQEWLLIFTGNWQHTSGCFGSDAQYSFEPQFSGRSLESLQQNP